MKSDLCATAAGCTLPDGGRWNGPGPGGRVSAASTASSPSPRRGGSRAAAPATASERQSPAASPSEPRYDRARELERIDESAARRRRTLERISRRGAAPRRKVDLYRRGPALKIGPIALAVARSSCSAGRRDRLHRPTTWGFKLRPPDSTRPRDRARRARPAGRRAGGRAQASSNRSRVQAQRRAMEGEHARDAREACRRRSRTRSATRSRRPRAWSSRWARSRRRPRTTSSTRRWRSRRAASASSDRSPTCCASRANEEMRHQRAAVRCPTSSTRPSRRFRERVPRALGVRSRAPASTVEGVMQGDRREAPPHRDQPHRQRVRRARREPRPPIRASRWRIGENLAGTEVWLQRSRQRAGDRRPTVAARIFEPVLHIRRQSGTGLGPRRSRRKLVDGARRRASSSSTDLGRRHRVRGDLPEGGCRAGRHRYERSQVLVVEDEQRDPDRV